MRGTKAKAIRHILDCPRRPRDMSTAERQHYRAVKRRYNRLPGGVVRELFLDDLSLVRGMIKMQQGGMR